jgi:BlaI family transcriptional regulator, penicillinase repressor
MARPRQKVLTDREAQIMAVLWDIEPATAEQVRRELADPPHDSSVRTILRILEDKGLITHRREGKAYLYATKVPRKQLQLSAARSLLERLFDGSARELVLCLLEQKELTDQDMDAALKAIHELKRQERRSQPDQRPKRRSTH